MNLMKKMRWLRLKKQRYSRDFSTKLHLFSFSLSPFNTIYQIGHYYSLINIYFNLINSFYKSLPLPSIHHKCPIFFLDTIHFLLSIYNLLLIYNLKHSQVGSCLIRLNARIFISIFHFFNYVQLEILRIE